MGKRKEGQREDDSSSSSSSCSFNKAKRRRPRHYQNGETSRPWEGFADVLRDAIIELKDAIQIKLSTEKIFKRKIEKIKEKRKKDKKKHEEDLRILKENFRILQEGHQDLKSKVHGMRKEGYAEADQYKASPSHRLQLRQSTRFRLVIENSVVTPIYKNETVETETGGGHIRVVMYDGGIPIASDHPLASAKVNIVVIEGRFNEPKRDSWSKEEFEKSIITPREGMTRLVKNNTFYLIDGSCNHPGAIIMDNSQKKEVKLGVMIAVHTEERVLEGVSNPFKVQEGKTKSSKKKGKKPSAPVPARNLAQPTSTHTTQHGQGPASPACPDGQHGLPPPFVQHVLQKADRGKQTEFLRNDTSEDNRLSYAPAIVPQMVEGNGQAVNGNDQYFSQQSPAQLLGQSTSSYSMQHGQVYRWAPPSTQNQLQAAANPHLPAHGQEQDASFPHGCSELDPLFEEWLSDIQLTLNPDDVPYSNAPAQVVPTDGSFRYCEVLLQLDEPHVELMLLYSTKARFYGESFPTTSLMDKAHTLLGSISSLGSVWKMTTSVTSRATQTPQRRGVLIRSIEAYDSDDEPPVKNQRNARYQLRFVNKVCNDYYTGEQIKSEDGTFLRVALYDENNLVVTSGPLSSAFVEVILLDSDFNAESQDYWTPEFRVYSLTTDGNFFPREKTPVFGGDRVLGLTDGEAYLGNINFLIPSSRAPTGKFRMGIQMKYVIQETVQEGITNPFVVRVRLGEELCHHRITPLEELHRVRIELPNQVCGALVQEGNIGASVLHDHSNLSEARARKIVALEDDKDDYNSDAHTTKSLKIKERAIHSIHDSGVTNLRSQLSQQQRQQYENLSPNQVGVGRSQLSQSTRFRLVIENSVSKIIYKNETVETEDGGGHIKVVMYDGGNPIAPDHPLASVKVDLVLIQGRFNEPKQDSWSKEEFEESILTTREGVTKLVKNGSFHLIGGCCDHHGAIIIDSSPKREVKLGVMMPVHREERVLEGVSNPFKVQEGRTKRSKRKGEKTSPIPTRNWAQPTSTHATQHEIYWPPMSATPVSVTLYGNCSPTGQGPVSPVCLDEQHGLPRPVIEDISQKADKGAKSRGVGVRNKTVRVGSM